VKNVKTCGQFFEPLHLHQLSVCLWNGRRSGQQTGAGGMHHRLWLPQMTSYHQFWSVDGEQDGVEVAMWYLHCSSKWVPGAPQDMVNALKCTYLGILSKNTSKSHFESMTIVEESKKLKRWLCKGCESDRAEGQWRLLAAHQASGIFHTSGRQGSQGDQESSIRRHTAQVLAIAIPFTIVERVAAVMLPWDVMTAV
jgi:hypothetical protein